MQTKDSTIETTLSLLQDLFDFYHPRDFAVRLWDGTLWPADEGQPTHFTLVLQHPGALRAMFLPPGELALGEAYIYNDYDIEGGFEYVFGLADRFLSHPWGGVEMERVGSRLLSLPATSRVAATNRSADPKIQGELHTRETDRESAAYIYDMPNSFYQLFLDRSMQYSCAYYARPEDGIDVAQARKIDYVCRKLRLRPGERVLDIGCGWGGFLIHAVRQYGVEGLGVTLSVNQVNYGSQRFREEGIENRCRVELRDYRDVAGQGIYDKIYSAGMVEQVGETMLPTYFKQAWQLLRPGGVFLVHGIAIHSTAPIKPSPSFVRRYVYPNGDIVPISTTLNIAESYGFEVRDVENLREHYVYTLRDWVRRLEEKADEARELVGDVMYRIWRISNAASMYYFQIGNTHLYQTLLVKADHGKSGLPLTRADWYA
ncbi:MAG: class I SAM-dependent methyltransferase [Chloroflexi bacterium]|nr:MAG: class I SAM-dependent methyltransferase [Chloroflexota bacterium]